MTSVLDYFTAEKHERIWAVTTLAGLFQLSGGVNCLSVGRTDLVLQGEEPFGDWLWLWGLDDWHCLPLRLRLI